MNSTLQRSTSSILIWSAYFLVLLCVHPLNAQDIPFRVMTYNGYYVSENDMDRYDAFRLVFEETQPDVLVMQEIVNTEGADFILSALNFSSDPNNPTYARAPFINGPDTDNMLFYRTDLVRFIHQDIIETDLRLINEYLISIGGNELYIYNAHFKSGEGTTNKTKRLNEATNLRNHLNQLPPGTEFLVAGDFNLYTSSEPAYIKLTSADDDSTGRAQDLLPDSLIGSWHAKERYASIHTQNTRVLTPDGANAGGVDDRFDFILSSFNLNDEVGIEYVDGSNIPFGNDGNHFDKAINDGFNAVVSQEVADALHDASDHLPVIADFYSISLDSLRMPLVISEILYDAPGIDSDEEWVEVFNRTDSTIHLGGWTLTDNNGTGYTFTFPEGYQIRSNSYLTAANSAGAFFNLYGYDADLYGTLPRLNNSGDALVLSNSDGQVVDKVAWEGGASSGVPVEWGSTTEPNAFRGFAIARVDVMVDTGSYLDWEVIGANGHPETQLTVQVASVGVEEQRQESIGFQTALHVNYPNPVRTSTTIGYSLATSEDVVITLYDMLGREVRTLVHTYQPAGDYKVDLNTDQLANGVYVYKMQTTTFVDSKQLIVVH